MFRGIYEVMQGWSTGGNPVGFISGVLAFYLMFFSGIVAPPETWLEALFSTVLAVPVITLFLMIPVFLGFIGLLVACGLLAAIEDAIFGSSESSYS